MLSSPTPDRAGLNTFKIKSKNHISAKNMSRRIETPEAQSVGIPERGTEDRTPPRAVCAKPSRLEVGKKQVYMCGRLGKNMLCR